MTEITAVRDPLKFAYWVPNVSGGLVVSTIEQRTDWSLDYNIRLAKAAEAAGFEYALSQVRYLSSYGAAQQHESTSISLALLLATEKLKVIAAVHPGLWQPGVLAKLITSSDHFSNGRAAINVVSGWLADEFTGLGEPWLDHSARYRRSAEFIDVVRALWTEDTVNYHGEFYNITDFSLRPAPVAVPGRAHPDIFMGGNSTDARGLGGKHADWYFSNGKDFDGFTEQYDEVSAIARDNNRTVRFGLNGFAIVRPTEREARDQLREIVARADVESVKAFGESVKQAGQSTADGKGMWSDSSFEDLVQYNDGFKTRLIGEPEQVARRILDYGDRGVDLVLLGFLHFIEEIQAFGRDVIPIVRQLETDRRVAEANAGAGSLV